MKDSVLLDAKTRDGEVSARNLRVNRQIPGVYYGKGVQSLAVQMEYQAFRKVYMQTGMTQLIDLNIDGKKKEKVLVHDITFHPLTGAITHVDFLHINMKEEITTEVPIEVTGIAPAVKDFGGILNTVKHEVEVKCLPSDIPHSLEVDISNLTELNAAIHISDLQVPAGVQVLDNPEDVVLIINPPRVEEVEAPPAEEVPAEGAEGAEGAAPAEGAAAGEKAEGEEKK